MTQDEELDALVAGALTLKNGCRDDMPALCQKVDGLVSAVTTLRAQLAEARENARWAYVQAALDDNQTELAAETARAARAEAALYQHEHAEKEGLTVSSMACQLMIAEAQAAQIEVDAGIVGRAASTFPSETAYCVEDIALEILDQPHDRTALDAVKRAAKVEAWREAAALMGTAAANCRTKYTYPPKTKEQRDYMTGAIVHGNAATAILALIEREGV